MLDLDSPGGVGCPKPVLLEWLRKHGLAALIYSSKSHTEKSPRWRVILILAREVSAAELRMLVGEIERTMQAEMQAALDPASKNSAQLWWAPARNPGHPYEAFWTPGTPLDPEPLLREGQQRVDEERRRRREAARPSRSEGNLEERAVRYLGTLPAATQGENGSRACFLAARVLRQRYGFDAETAYRLLRDHYPQFPKFSERELRHKVASADRSRARRPHGAYRLMADEPINLAERRKKPRRKSKARAEGAPSSSGRYRAGPGRTVAT